MISMVFVILFFGLGVIVGLCFFSSLHRSVQLILTGGQLGQVCLLFLFRLALAVATFYFAIRMGALDLAAAIIGFTLARFLDVRRWSL